MSEFIIIQVGQCGNQIGSVLLSEILEEYAIATTSSNPSSSEEKKLPILQQYVSSFFNIGPNHNNYKTLDDLIKSNVKARVICIDMEESVVARFKSGKFKKLYHKKSFITNYPGSGNNWAEGYRTHGQIYKELILDAVKFNVEHCDNLHGFLLIFSAGGGTGSGLGSYIVKLLNDHYPTIDRFVIIVYATGTEDVITCPYNMALATEQLNKHATCVFPIENRILFDILYKQESPHTENTKLSCFRTFEDMNKVIVDMILHLTSGSRFPGNLNLDMNEINTNMVPFPSLNFLSSGFSPLTLKSVDSLPTGNLLKHANFTSCCSRNNQLIKIDPLDPHQICISTTLLGRGNYSMNDLRNYVDKLRTKVKFAPWSNKSIKVGLCNVPPKTMNYTMFSLFNTTAISDLYEIIFNQFMKLYRRKAHIHHYTNVNGFEDEDFIICKNSLSNVIQLYSELRNN